VSPRPLRVCIDARATPEGGGVRQVLIGLAGGLAELGGEDEYLFLVFDFEQDWLRPYLPHSGSLIPVPEVRGSLGRRLLRETAGRTATLRRLAGGSRKAMSVAVPESDGAVERAGADVVHLAIPMGFRTRLPSVYTVYDLQHLHFPEYFHPATTLRRDTSYRALSDQAGAVTTLTHWGRKDLLEKYGLEPEKVFAGGLAPVLSLYPAPDDEVIARMRGRVPEQFAFFPANTWPHKNHLALLEALAQLRHRGLDVPLVCSGAKTDFYGTIEARVRDLQLEESVRFLDYVGPAELRAVYELCRCVVFPTKFEGWGMPLTEAFAAGRPAACSAIPPLLEQTNDAAVMFDPDDPATIADAIAQVWTDEALRAELVEKGSAEAATLSWPKIARLYRALYRKVAGEPLTDEEADALRPAQSSLSPA
jgi:glycosyltransferase involved in cell wall biosynthesis